MDKALIEKLATETDLVYASGGALRTPFIDGTDMRPFVEAFAALIAEECAKLCDERMEYDKLCDQGVGAVSASMCAMRIRVAFRK